MNNIVSETVEDAQPVMTPETRAVSSAWGELGAVVRVSFGLHRLACYQVRAVKGRALLPVRTGLG